jgi:Pyrimidine dimer DNA glycosylase
VSDGFTREALLAQKVLQNSTRGYKHHPQLARFKETHDPLAAIAAYLRAVHLEAARRGYAFDLTKIALVKPAPEIRCTEGQILHGFNHLKGKLRSRDRSRLLGLHKVQSPQAHPDV